MARVVFTRNLQRHVACPPSDGDGSTVAEVLDSVFVENAAVKGYVVDEQGVLRKHMVIFVDGEQIRDRNTLSDPVSGDSEIHVMQALSGG
jgi:hypothetical protein